MKRLYSAELGPCPPMQPGDVKETFADITAEESAFGTSMLCAVELTGNRGNFGPFSRTDRDTFIRKAAEVASKQN